MVLGSGIDVIEVSEFRRELACGVWTSAEGIFRDSELPHNTGSDRYAETLARIFVTKEAVVKALGMPAVALDVFGQIEVLDSSNGAIEVHLHDEVLRQFHTIGARRVLAAAHSTPDLATAMVILEA